MFMGPTSSNPWTRNYSPLPLPTSHPFSVGFTCLPVFNVTRNAPLNLTTYELAIPPLVLGATKFVAGYQVVS